MIKQLLFSFLLLGSLGACAMNSTSGAAQSADASIPRQVLIAEREALINLYQDMEFYVIDGSENRLDSIQVRISQVDCRFPYNDGYHYAKASLYDQVCQLIVLLTQNGLEAADDNDRSYFGRKLVRAYAIRGLLDAQVEAQSNCSHRRLDNPAEPEKAPAQPRRNQPKLPLTNSGAWSFGYRPLLGGLGFVAVVATVIQYQRNRDKK